jgi:hypothetical protein
MPMVSEFAELMKTKIRKKLPSDQLMQRIDGFLKSQTMCVLCTSKNDIPRATPLEYYSDGTTIYIIGDPGTKIENIKVNPRVSIGVYNNVHPIWTHSADWLSAKAAQITGEATLLTDDNPEYFEALKVYKWQLFAEALGRDLSQPPRGGTIIKVKVKKIEYMEFALKREGYASRQLWEVSES